MQEHVFRDKCKREGYDEPVLVEWGASTFNERHTHDVDCSLLVLSGEVAFGTSHGQRTCRPGDTELLTRNTPHTERVGPEGVSFLLARK